MTFQTIPEPFQSPEGSQFHNLILDDFERFYREHLRNVANQRMRASDLAELNRTWSRLNGAAPINSKHLKLCMALVGHQSLRSNGMFFLSVGNAADFPAIADNLAPIDRSKAAAVLSTRTERRANLETVLAGIWTELFEIRKCLERRGQAGRTLRG